MSRLVVLSVTAENLEEFEEFLRGFREIKTFEATRHKTGNTTYRITTDDGSFNIFLQKDRSTSKYTLHVFEELRDSRREDRVAKACSRVVTGFAHWKVIQTLRQFPEYAVTSYKYNEETGETELIIGRLGT